MARKIREKDTDIIYDDDLVDLIDEKLEEESPIKSALEQPEERSDDVFDDLDLDEFITDSKDTTKVAPAKIAKQEPIRTKPHLVKNPFDEKTESEKPTYSDVVDMNYTTPKMDVRPYTPIPVKKSKKRFKLWLVTGVCSVCLVACATLIGAFGLGAGAGSNALNSANVETGELASQQGIVNETDSPLTEAEIRDWLSKGKNLPKNVTRGNQAGSSVGEEAITNSSMWDKFCDFFSRLFGR